MNRARDQTRQAAEQAFNVNGGIKMKKKDTEAIAEALRKIGEGFTQIADALAGANSTAATTTTERTAPVADSRNETTAPAESITFEELRGLLASKAAQGHRSDVKELLKSHNATCLSELESHPELFPIIKKEAEMMGNG